MGKTGACENGRPTNGGKGLKWVLNLYSRCVYVMYGKTVGKCGWIDTVRDFRKNCIKNQGTLTIHTFKRLRFKKCSIDF